MKTLIVLILLLMAAVLPVPARAVDPVTVTAAAPKAFELASIWSPHAINALQSGGIGLMKIGESAVSILLLPAGILQCTLGAPFGMFSNGVDNFIKGICAPFELVYQVILLPVRIISLGTVR
ncbi:MAG: hypothetical protein IKC94_05895 [Lentisphaeria bacterium]|nr:hypothetical protein [Lentisphaeria bacterium]